MRRPRMRNVGGYGWVALVSGMGGWCEWVVCWHISWYGWCEWVAWVGGMSGWYDGI